MSESTNLYLRKNSQKGITLIALIITIIILIILASVSAAIAIGENGILRKTAETTEKAKMASVTEDVQIAWGSLTAEYDIELYVRSTDKSKADFFTENAINNELQLGQISRYSGYNLDGDTTFTYTLRSTGEKYKISIDTRGNVTIELYDE